MSQAPMNDAKATRVPPELAPLDYCDPVIEACKKDLDRTLLRENLKLNEVMVRSLTG